MATISEAFAGAVTRYATIAARNADTSGAEGRLSYVYNNNGSSTDPANGFYQLVGGAWQSAAWVPEALQQFTNRIFISDMTVGYGGQTAVPQNVAVGDEALQSSTLTGPDNIGIGLWAGRAITTGSRNVLVGTRTGQTNTTGSENTFVGFEAGSLQATASTSVGIGSGALSQGAGGLSYSTAVGYKAARLYAGEGVTAVGANALVQATGVRNTALGRDAGSLTTTGTGQTAIGYNAQGGAAYSYTIAIGYSAQTDADRQIALGSTLQKHMKLFGQEFARWHTHASGDNFWLWGTGPAAAPTGWGNLGVGKNALPALTTGYRNTAVGLEALNATTATINCVAVGMQAARQAVDADDCVWIGALAGRNTTTGVGDTLVGFRSGQNITTALNNTALGDSAFFMNSLGAAGVAVGYTSAEYMTDGTNGVFIGSAAARARLNAQRCVYIGVSAGEISSNYPNCNPADGSGGIAAGQDNVGVGNASLNECLGSRVTAVGSGSGGSLVGTTDQDLRSTFVGFNAGNNGSQKTDAYNSIAIGANAYTDKDNQVVIGDSGVAETVLRGVTRHTTHTVAGLPSAATMGAGARAFVTDANVTTFNSVVAGGGSNKVPVFSDGAAWRVG